MKDYWKSCKVSEFLVKGEKVFKLTATGESTPKGSPIKWLYLSENTYNSLLATDDLDVLKDDLPVDIFEFIKNGPFDCVEENNNAKFIQKAFVTNAVANLVVGYAYVYLKEIGLSGRQIIGLRKKYSLSKISTDRFTQKELLGSFINQSAFFMNLVAHMHGNDRFEKVIEQMDDKAIEDGFKFSINREDLLNKYRNRNVYHWLLECEYMRSDYKEEGVYHQNTKVFAETDVMNPHSVTAGGYLVSTTYLRSLGMRVCKKCQDWDNFL